ncbi:hypothetical protein FNV43_RR17368 [Rhamnella rubrinervis]|uniref:BHLH domain-containing protein n=1 Tax=Rhamnella rubrinervis TaxID=2594499 RepID=A0A8K0GVN7_9ROSA|nr:hypothetical protein FNV43_RR17368 [Rhamnella rubrinervis]
MDSIDGSDESAGYEYGGPQDQKIPRSGIINYMPPLWSSCGSSSAANNPIILGGIWNLSDPHTKLPSSNTADFFTEKVDSFWQQPEYLHSFHSYNIPPGTDITATTTEERQLQITLQNGFRNFAPLLQHHEPDSSDHEKLKQQKAKCEEEEEEDDEEEGDEKQNADNNTSSSPYGEVMGKLEDKSCLHNRETSREGHRPKGGQTMSSHSLAERVRREKINERMKFLQDLVPGCDKITGKALMLDEIINYVQSLQRQVEFLSMKLATVRPEIKVDMERF